MGNKDPAETGSASTHSLSHALQLSEERYRLLVDAARDYAIFMLDPNGMVSSWNQGAALISGYSADDIIGSHFSRFHTPENIERGWPEHSLKQALSKGHFEDEGWRQRQDGSRFWANVVITALLDEHGELRGYSNIMRDLSDRKHQEDSLRKSEERFRLLIEGVKDCAIFLLNPEGIVSSWNSGSEKINGYKAEEIIGSHFSRLYLAEQVSEGLAEQALDVAKVEGSFEGEGWSLRDDGTGFWAHISVTALHEDNGELYGFAVVTRDMTIHHSLQSLQTSEQRMHEFLAMLSHELRNPLAPIRSALASMESASEDDSVQDRSRELIERQVTHIARLIDDLTEASRITTGTINIVREAVDLREVLSTAVEAAMPLIQTRRHKLEQSVPAIPVTVHGDPVRLTQAVHNLLNNAAKYTPPGGEIRLSLTKGGAESNLAHLRVSDSGRGIAPERLDEIFGLFTQLEPSLDRSEGGMGIGLSLAHRVVELHGGSIKAVSEGEGRGSQFDVVLPLLQGAAVETSAGSSALQPNHGLRVMVVEDLVDVAEGMEMVLGLWGHHVRVVHDGPRALEMAPQFHPDAILLDIGLPGMNGYEVAENLRKLPGLKEARLIAVTGYGLESDRQRALESGFDHHLIKGSSLDELRALLSRPH